MNSDDESKWLRDRMALLRRRRNASVAGFHGMWQSIQKGRNPRQVEWTASWRLAGASFAALVLLGVFVLLERSKVQESHHQEREYATVEAILMTNWQAPSDDLIRFSKEDPIEQ